MFPGVHKPLRVESLDELATRAGISLRSLLREIERGTGPTLTRMTPRRQGVLEPDGDACFLVSGQLRNWWSREVGTRVNVDR